MRRSRQPQYKRVALAIGIREYAFQRRKTEGIIDYYAKHCAWELRRNEQLRPFAEPEELAGWVGDGVIGEIYTEEDASSLRSLGIPIVNTSSSGLAGDLPTVSPDNQAIGRMAAEHLLDLKLDKFAFVGPVGLSHVKERLEGFSQALKEAGARCEVVLYEPVQRRRPHDSQEMVDPSYLQDAVAKLKLPIGVMASSDRVGFSVLEASRALGLRSPEDVSLVGVDNDNICCQFAHSTMTSIDPNAWEVGYRAAALLDRLMSGQSVARTRLRIRPSRILFRNSTDRTRSKYPEVARALRFIRNHAHEFIDVTNVLDVVPMSRRWLEMKFREEVGHGIYTEIRRVHVERAKALLASTDWPVLRVARESGFNNPERFDFAFQKLVGMSASEYRRRRSRKTSRGKG